MIFITASLQAQSTTTLRGTVTDSSGAVVSGADVSATNTATGIQRATKTDSTGNYELAALPIGSYDVRVQMAGMQTQSATGVTLPVSQIVVKNFQLGVAKTSEI